MGHHDNAPFLERRVFARLRKEFVVRVMPGEKTGTAERHLPYRELTGTNISLGGIALETDRAYRPGSTLSLEILLPERRLPESAPETRLFRVQSRVIWSHPSEKGKFTTGLCFIGLDERELRTLSRLIGGENE